MASHNNVCGHVAIINLFKLRGLKPPTLDQVIDGLDLLGTVSGSARIGNPDDPVAVDILNFLSASGLIVALLGIPPAFWPEPQKLLTRFLDVGCHVLLFFNWRKSETGKVLSHVTLAEGYDGKGYHVIDGEPGYYPEGKTIELEPEAISPEESAKIRQWMESNSHGSRQVLPYYPIGLSTPESLALGLTSHALIVYPLKRVD
jgi:hypothetical protein